MKNLICLLAHIIFTTKAVAASSDMFSVEMVDQSVCRTQPGVSVRCIPTFKALGLITTDEIKLLETVAGGAKVMTSTGISQEQVYRVLNSYRELSIRNLATHPSLVTTQNGLSKIPFVATVRWKGRGFMEGTLNVDGEIRIAQTTINAAAIAFADSTTEAKSEHLRIIETAARRIHFRISGTGGRSVDEATMDLLNNVVGPAILAEILRGYPTGNLQNLIRP